MKILITGGAGYIGSHTCIELLSGSHEVLIYDNLSNSSIQAVERIKLITNKSFEFVKGDIRDSDLLCKTVLGFQPETIIHFAGLKAVGDSVLEPINYYDVNVCGTLELLRAMKKSNCKSIIFSSSATVYGVSNTLPYCENDELDPTNPYGRSKYMVEQILSDWVNSNNYNRAVCLRYFNPVGAHKSGLIGENPIGVPNNIMPLIAQVAIGKRKYISIFGDDYPTRDGTGERDFIHVVDLAKGHAKAVELSANFKRFDVLNLGTGRSTTVKELIAVFEKVSGKKIPIKITSRRLGDVAKSWANPKRANTILGLSFERSVEQMCLDTWQWQSLQPNVYDDD